MQRLEVNLVRSRANIGDAELPELPAWQQQLRSMVQAGIPMVGPTAGKYLYIQTLS